MKHFASLSFCVVVFLFALLLAIPSACAQATTSLRGTITDPSGAAIPNATVRLTNADTNLERTATSDAEGNYVFSSVTPGNYTVDVEIAGFAKYHQTGVQLQVNLPATLNVKMKIGQAQETVTVTEQAPVLNTTDASEGNTMGQVQLTQLPIEARDIVQLLSIQPGVVYTSDRTDMDTNVDTRSGAVNGERSDQSNVTLDGVDDNQQASGAAFQSVLPVPIASVEEFRVTTSNYGADQGRSSGAQAALLTKSGGNDFHGGLYEFNRNRLGEANDYFIKSAQAADNLPNKALQLVRNVFGADVGGPIKKERLFFFINYEGHRVAQQDSAVRTIPTASLRDGVIMYLCDQGGTGAPLDSRCNNPTPVAGKSGKPYTPPAGYYALGPSAIAGMDPLGLGPDPASLTYFNTYPLPNDQSTGDNYNYSGYRFAAPASERDDWAVAKIDYKITANGNHTLFWRGSGANDHQNRDPFLPGYIPEFTVLDRSKGFVVGYTALLRSNLVNNFHYGFTRQSLNNLGDTTTGWIIVRGLDQDRSNYTNGLTLPVNQLADDLSWTKGNHTLDFGADIRFIRSASSNLNSSFSYAYTNSEWINTSGFAGKPSSPFNPANNGYPGVDSSFNISYDWPLIGMLGMVTEDQAQTNFLIGSGGSATTLDQGAPVIRHFSTDEFNLYVQDSWKIRPNLTFNYGLRYELMSPVGETHGQQVMPTFPLGQWFNQRGLDAAQGISSSAPQTPDISFDLAGPAYGRSSFYGWQTKNFAPRVSLAWSPQPSWGFLQKLLGTGTQSVIRAGFGMYYDHFGYELVQTYDQNGSFGLLSNLGNPAGAESADCSPRLTGLTGLASIPQKDLCGNQMYIPTATPTFPDKYPLDNFCICWGVDNNLKTPYSYALDLSFQRQITKTTSLEFAYVGHLAHRLLAQDDLAMPLNLVDPKSKISYYTAVQALAKQYSAGATDETFNESALGPTAQYWQDMIAPLQSGGAYAIGANPLVSTYLLGGCYNPSNLNPPMSTTDPALAAFDLFCSGATNETTPLALLDVYGGIPDANLSGVFYTPATGEYSYFDNQFSSLYAWRTMAPSWYHGFQVTLKQQMAHGLQFDFNYTYSHAIDMTSSAERVGTWGGTGENGWITNAWDPRQELGDSDFDLRHQINADFVWQLPFGRGRWLGNDISKGADALVGGWQISGLARWTSGFDVTVDNGGVYPTDWQLEGFAALSGSPIAQKKSLVDGYINMFSDPVAAYAGFRHDYPGETGARNPIRGDGYAGLDLGLAKTWKMPYNDRHALEFTWNVFNVPNLSRFDVQTASLVEDTANTFGRYTHLLTNPRVMQFSLSYTF